MTSTWTIKLKVREFPKPISTKEVKKRIRVKVIFIVSSLEVDIKIYKIIITSISIIFLNGVDSFGIFKFEINKIIKLSKKIVILSGAGISAESGISTFRDAGGLWEGHDINEVATPQGFAKNPKLVLDFYNQRRRQLKDVKPNLAHTLCAKLENKYQVVVITQNVDNLHERAGSNRIIHLHGELNKVRSTKYPELIYDWEKDLNMGDNCEKGSQLRPHIVWFGEAVPMIENAIDEIYNAHIVIVIGTSMQVYPAAGLVGYASHDADIYYIDPAPSMSYDLNLRQNLTVIKEKASIGMQKLYDQLMASEI